MYLFSLSHFFFFSFRLFSNYFYKLFTRGAIAELLVVKTLHLVCGVLDHHNHRSSWGRSEHSDVNSWPRSEPTWSGSLQSRINMNVLNILRKYELVCVKAIDEQSTRHVIRKKLYFKWNKLVFTVSMLLLLL